MFEQIVLYLYTTRSYNGKKKKSNLNSTRNRFIIKFKNTYAFIQNSLGNLEILVLQTEQTLEQIEGEKLSLETQYVQEQANESNLFEQLTKKYGAGNLDITTGVFTPNEK